VSSAKHAPADSLLCVRAFTPSGGRTAVPSRYRLARGKTDELSKLRGRVAFGRCLICAVYPPSPRWWIVPALAIFALAAVDLALRDADRYSFIAVDFHHILLAGLPAHSLALRPAHSRGHLYVTSYTEGFSHFVTSMTAPVAWRCLRVTAASARLSFERRLKSEAFAIPERHRDAVAKRVE
jgi:hypothetical protein